MKRLTEEQLKMYAEDHFTYSKMSIRLGRSGELYKGYFIFDANGAYGVINIKTEMMFTSWTVGGAKLSIDRHKMVCFRTPTFSSKKWVKEHHANA